MIGVMNKKVYLSIILSMGMSLAHAEQPIDETTCVLPDSPAIPVNAKTEEKVLEVVATVKSYQKELNEFRGCLDKLKKKVDKKSKDKEEKKKNKAHNAKLDSVYNLSVDKEGEIVGELNMLIKQYKHNASVDREKAVNDELGSKK